MAVQTPGGELFGYVAPATGNTVEIPIVLVDAAGAAVTGVTYDAAGMAVTYRKEGQHTYSAFPTFGTDNWIECGGGEYLIIIRESDADELALMDTVGTLTFQVTCTAAVGINFAKVKVNSADTVRVGTGTGQLSVTGGMVDLVDAPNATAVAAIADALSGTGANTVTVTVRTAGGTVYEGVKVTLNNQTETLAAPLMVYTNASGQSVFHVDAGAWRAIVPATGAQGGGATNFTVDGAEAVTVTVVAASIPAPVSADNYILYGYARKTEADAPFGASGMTVKIINMDADAQVDGTANATRAIMGTSYTTDAAGLWSFEIAQALAGTRLRLQFAWTDAASVPQTEEWEAEINAAVANVSDQIAWADLSPTRKR